MRRLASTTVTPNQLTTARLLAGLAAAAAFAAGSRAGDVAGAVLFILALLLDRADGDLARLTGKTSRFGHRYDLWSDGACNALAFVGIGIGLSGGALGAWAVPLGCLAGGAVAAILLLVLWVEAAGGARAGEVAGFAGVDPDDAVLAVPIALLLGWNEALLLAAAIGAPAFALLMLWLLRRRMRGR